MPVTFGKKKNRQTNIVNTIITIILLCSVFLYMVSSIYATAKENAYETLHLQTKQIKDDITLQIMSDRENLQTMANFAAKLYADGEGYDLMFESFNPIGLIENIGILNPDNMFIIKSGSLDLNGRISFEEEVQRGVYISGRIKDVTRDDYEIIRTAVPIRVDGAVVGILYGVIKLDKISTRYINMAKELNAQLFVYEKSSGNLMIDTVHDELGNISFLKDRKYNDGSSYEQFVTTDKGFLSFESAYRDETLHLHYSEIEDLGWTIALGRYDNEVFSDTNKLIRSLLLVFAIMFVIMILYVIILLSKEKQINGVLECASEVRKTLLEVAEDKNNVLEALALFCKYTKARYAVIFDTNGEEFNYVAGENETKLLSKSEREYFKNELFRYATEYYKTNKKTVSIMSITPNVHLLDTNIAFFNFLKEHEIKNISLATVVNNKNHITILGIENSRRVKLARILAERIVACFSISLYTRRHMNETEIAATTDPLTGVLNRFSYENDISLYAEEKMSSFSCVYVDVNELHICNNKYGHIAGDEMLIFIANAIKEVFYGQKIYRIGGDEFLVFVKNSDQKFVKRNIDALHKILKGQNYHVSVGMSYCEGNPDIADLVREAEVKMYEEKALYYQNKEHSKTSVQESDEYVQMETGIKEIDAILSILNENYTGIYRVSLDTNKAKRILMPTHFNFNETEENFLELYSKYVYESVDPDYHRGVLSFANYDVIKQQLKEGNVPQITYKKLDGENVTLSVYKLCSDDEVASETLWVFAKNN